MSPGVGCSCASGVGYQEGVGAVPVFLGGPACLRKGTIQHEILHTLGMWHEHTRPDRDQHVTILWGNIAAGESEIDSVLFVLRVVARCRAAQERCVAVYLCTVVYLA